MERQHSVSGQINGLVDSLGFLHAQEFERKSTMHDDE